MKHIRVPFSVAVVAAITVAAVGTASAASPVAAVAKSKAPIKILTFGDITGLAPTPLTYLQDGVKASVNAFNAAGGVQGRKVELIECNSQLNPADAANCVVHAKQEGVVAAVPSLELLDNVTTPILDKEGIPIFGDPSTETAQFSKTSACFVNGPFVLYPAAATALAKEGAKNLSIMAPQAAGQNVLQAATALAAAAGGGKAPASAFLPIPATATDFSSIAASATSGGETGSFISVNAPGIFSVLGDMLQAKPTIKLAIPGYVIQNPEVLAGFAQVKGVKNVYVDNYTAFPTDTSVPGIKLYQQQISKVNKADIGQETALFPWLDAWGAMQVLKTVTTGPITASTVLAAMKKATLNFEGVTANWHYSYNTLGLGCVSDPDVYTGVYNGGTTVTPTNGGKPVVGIGPKIIAYYKKALG